MDHRYMKIGWGGQTFELTPQKALHWIEKETLIFSDVHLGKAHDMQALGVPIPAAVHDEDLDRMHRLLETHRARRVLVLGDFVHSHRTDLDDLILRFHELLKSHPVEWVLALGNHDWPARDKLRNWGFDRIVRDFEEDGILFAHDTGGEHDRALITGHVHPVIRLGHGRDRMRLPCFVVNDRRILLPSFGTFTGGFEIKPGPGDRIFVTNDEMVFDL